MSSEQHLPVRNDEAAVFNGNEGEVAEVFEAELDLTPGVEDTHDPVRTYLREMGRVPLLKREGEVILARRIERGEMIVLKAVSRSLTVVQELIAAGNALRNGSRSIETF